jgi:hypothetical protein
VRGRRLGLILLFVALAGVAAFSGCGSSPEATSTGAEASEDTTAPAKTEHVPPPSGPVAPAKALARIAAAPEGAGVISGAEFDQGMTQAASTRGLKKIPKPGDEEYAGMRDEVLGGLIIDVWLEGEAEEMGIEPTDGEVAATLRKSGEEDSLREHEYTQATMLERTKNSLLVEEIEDALAKQSPKNPQKAYSEFDARFQRKWHARTHCVKGFVVQQCGNSGASG